jgi:hypothetical protein
MADCTDCIPQIPDPCNGKKTPTECILSLHAIPSLGVTKNEQLDLTLQKIGNLLQTMFTSIEGYDPNEIQTLKNNEGTLQWVTE